MNSILVVGVVLGTVVSGSVCAAQELRESYKALLSERDHFNTSGQRLTSAAAIIRQDRANVHRYGLRDATDQDDVFFADIDRRADLERMIEMGTSEPRAIRSIVDGLALVRVDIYEGPQGPFVNVSVLAQ